MAHVTFLLLFCYFCFVYFNYWIQCTECKRGAHNCRLTSSFEMAVVCSISAVHASIPMPLSQPLSRHLIFLHIDNKEEKKKTKTKARKWFWRWIFAALNVMRRFFYHNIWILSVKLFTGMHFTFCGTSAAYVRCGFRFYFHKNCFRCKCNKVDCTEGGANGNPYYWNWMHKLQSENEPEKNVHTQEWLFGVETKKTRANW